MPARWSSACRRTRTTRSAWRPTPRGRPGPRSAARPVSARADPLPTILADLGQAVPLPTQILLSVSAGFQHYWWAGVLLILAAVLAWRVWTGTPEGRVQWDQTLLGLPLTGPRPTKGGHAPRRRRPP